MKIEEHEALISKLIAGHTDSAVVTEVLTKLREDYKNVNTELGVISSRSETLEKENKEIREKNMDLFLRIGTPVKKEEEPDEDIDPEKVFNDTIKAWEGLI